jgi:hypothetical protein
MFFEGWGLIIIRFRLKFTNHVSGISNQTRKWEGDVEAVVHQAFQTSKHSASSD